MPLGGLTLTVFVVPRNEAVAVSAGLVWSVAVSVCVLTARIRPSVIAGVTKLSGGVGRDRTEQGAVAEHVHLTRGRERGAGAGHDLAGDVARLHRRDA